MRMSPCCTIRWRSALLLVALGSAVAVLPLAGAEPTLVTGQEDAAALTLPDTRTDTLRCALSFIKLKFDIGNFAKYDTYFTSDAVMQLAQTGSFTGPLNIQEYVGFAYEKYSPYFSSGPDTPDEIRYKGPLGNAIHFADVTSNGECTILNFEIKSFTTNPTNARCKVKYNRSNLIKIIYNYKTSKITRINLYYPPKVLDLVFGYLLDSDVTRSYICSVVADKCLTYIAPIYNCTDQVDQLPVLTSGPSGDAYLDGKTQGCRALHAFLAYGNPYHHCPHVAIQRTVDPDGFYKCQQSAGTSVSDLFTKQELDSYNRFLKRSGLYPNGHDANSTPCGN